MPRKKRKSSVNKSGNYTKPALRKRIFNRILRANIQGTAAGKWSARKKLNCLQSGIKLLVVVIDNGTIKKAKISQSLVQTKVAY